MTGVWEDEVVTGSGRRAAELIIVLIVLAILAFVIGSYIGSDETTESDGPNAPPLPSSKVIYPIFRIVRMRVSAYCQCERCCGKWSDGITANGHIIQPGDKFAAAPPQIPFGTELTVPGYAEGTAVAVLDRGGAIQGNKLDVFFDDHDEALAWGVKYLDVKIWMKTG